MKKTNQKRWKKECGSSPVGAEYADAAALVLSSAQEVQDPDSDEDDDEVKFTICSVFFPLIYLTSLFYTRILMKPCSKE